MTPRCAAILLTLAKRNIVLRRDRTPLHKAADLHLNAVKLAATYAFLKGKAAVDKGALKRATTEREAHAAMDGAPAAVRRAAIEALAPVLAKAFVAGMNAGSLKLKAASIRTFATFNTKFNVTNPEAVKWAEQHAAELAVGLSDTTREDISDAIASALEGDQSPADAYDNILAAVGDEARADLIARTETMTAVNEGQRASWDNAVEDGLLSPSAQVEWIATSDCCDDCDDLDGETRDLDGEYPNDGGDGPPLHPNCRCTEGISA